MSGVTESALQEFDKVDDRTIARMIDVYRAVVSRYAPVSSVLAIRQYMEQRAGVLTPFRPHPVTVPDLAPLRVEWAIHDAIGPGGIDISQMQQMLAASAAKTVHDAGRDTIITNVRRDRAATAWARIPEPELTKTGTCGFCAMLAARGAVYKKDTVGFLAHVARGGKGHNCVCHAEPVFGKYQPGDLVKKYQELWQSSVVDQGRHTRDARAAFRQAIEGRDVTGLDKKLSAAQRQPLAHAASDVAKPKPGTVRFRSVDVTNDQARGIIANLQRSNARIGSDPKFAKLRGANDARIAQLRSQLGE